MVKAQLKIAEQQGATILRETVTGLKSQPDGVTLTTDAGREIRAKRLLLTTGAWSEFLSGHELGLVPTPRTIVMARVSQAEAHRLRHLPSIIFYAGLDNPNLTGIYMLPPIRYPDGEMYIKIGGRLNEVAIPQSAAELTEWFQGQGSQLEAESLASELFSIVTDLIVEATVIKPCVVTQTNSMEPLIEAIEPGHGGLGRIVVAAGGCGAAAKSSNEIGRLTALKMVG